MKEILISENTKDQRLNKFLERLLCSAEPGFIYKMLRKKNITLNDRPAKGNERLQAGDCVRIYFSDETYEKFTAPARNTDQENYPVLKAEWIVYEDPNLLILNKPAGMLSQRAKEGDLSACEYLIGYLMESKQINRASLRDYRPSPVNRLDRNTSGLLLCAKTLAAARELSAILKDRTLKKEYVCIVKGKVTGSSRLRGYLKKDETTNTVAVSRDEKDGNFIETSYTPIRFCDKLNATVLSVDLITGKTHQIRAHLASEGHPIAGDPKYGDPAWNKQLSREHHIKYQLLHAYRLLFPEMKGTLAYLSGREFTCDLPFQSLYEE